MQKNVFLQKKHAAKQGILAMHTADKNVYTLERIGPI